MTSLPPLLPNATLPPPVMSAGLLPVVEAPADLAVLPVGTRIAGEILSGGKDAIAIKTEIGTIIVESAVPLPKGALASLLVQTAAPHMVLRITHLATPQGEQAPMAMIREQAAAFKSGLAGGDAAGAPVRIEAIVLRPLAGAVFGTALGAASGAASGAGAELSQTAGAEAELDAPLPFPAGTRLSLRILIARLGDIPIGASADPASPRTSRPSAGQTITASVVRTDGAGRPLLISSAGPLVLATAAYLPPDWAGELEILSVSPPPDPSADALAAQGRTGGSGMVTDWQTLGHVLGVLNQIDPAAARHVSETVLPQPTSSLAATILKVLGFLRHGDVRSWIGDDAHRALARAQPGLAERLGTDMRKLARDADGGAGGDWRAFTIPLVIDGGLAAIRMLIRYRPQAGEKTGAEDDDSTRFVLDLALSHLGRMQIDGLVQAHSKQFDLIVRTERPLSAEVQGGIRYIFAEARILTGLRGAVGFHAAPAHFLDIVTLPAANDSLRGSLVI